MRYNSADRVYSCWSLSSGSGRSFWSSPLERYCLQNVRPYLLRRWRCPDPKCRSWNSCPSIWRKCPCMWSTRLRRIAWCSEWCRRAIVAPSISLIVGCSCRRLVQSLLPYRNGLKTYVSHLDKMMHRFISLFKTLFKLKRHCWEAMYNALIQNACRYYLFV